MTAKQIRTTSSALELFAEQQRPLEQMGEFQANMDKALGLGSMRKLHEALALSQPAAGLASRLAGPLSAQGINLSTSRALEKIDWSGVLGERRLDELAARINASAGFSEAMRKADLYGALKLPEGAAAWPEVQRSILLGSAAFDATRLAGIRPTQLDEAIGAIRFEVGGMLTGLRPIDDKATLCGRKLTTSAFAELDAPWRRQLDVLHAGDLVAPIRGVNEERVIAAFPPDLIEEQPLQAEFEVDLIIAENQREAQVFLALRSQTASARMRSAQQRLLEGDQEALAQCMTSCRRALVALADLVYPARSGTVTDRSGVDHQVGPEQFKNRLLMFLTENVASGTTLKVAEKQFKMTLQHLDSLIDHLSKGVHDDVDRDEVKQAYIETWVFISHVARIAD